ncbi:MAG TPA: ABC transporter permease, partial [Nitrososphaerales archaeon]|nr:ABC transporter permease [Nitrososphaerales archaeon]
WSMASQFNWDKQEGLFEIYLTSPASISAILIGMSLGGIIGTVPSALIVTGIGWFLFHPAVNASWGGVALTFGLTLASLYSMGMVLASLYLTYGREAESMNEVLQEPVSMLSGLYFPSIGSGSPFPFAIQAAASLIPLTIGMDALRKTLFYGSSPQQVFPDLLILAVMAVVLLFVSTSALKLLERKGRKDGTVSVRIR